MSICVNLIPDSYKQDKGEAKVSHCGKMDLLGWKVPGKVVRPGLGSGEALGPTETTRLLVPDAPTTTGTDTTVLQHTPLIAQRRVLPAGSAQKDASSHWLYLFDFSPLCVFQMCCPDTPTTTTTVVQHTGRVLLPPSGQKVRRPHRPMLGSNVSPGNRWKSVESSNPTLV